MKGNKIKAILLIAIFILSTLAIAIPIASAETSITIDGVTSAGEWDGALDINVAEEVGSVKVLASTDYLYVLFDIVDSTDARTDYPNEVGNDQISINVNPTDGGAWGFPYDLIFETSALSGGQYLPDDGGHHQLPWNPKVNSGTSDDGWATRWFPNDAQEDLPEDLESATIYSGGNRITEWKLPLESSPGDVLQLGGAVDVGDGNSYIYPFDLDWGDASTFVEYSCNVLNENTGFYYPTIQVAIDEAESDDTLLVYPGTYEEAVVIDKLLTLQGEDRETTEIKFGYVYYPSEPTITISADDVTVSGFTIRSGPYIEPAWTIAIEGDNALLTDLNVIKETCLHQFGGNPTNHGAAFWLAPSLDGFTLTESTVESEWNGIYTREEGIDITVQNVDFTYPGEYGFFLKTITGATIEQNTFTCTADQYGVIVTRGSDDIEVTDNQFVGSGSTADSHVGIILQAWAPYVMGDITITENDFSDFQWGIFVDEDLEMLPGAEIITTGNIFTNVENNHLFVPSGQPVVVDGDGSIDSAEADTTVEYTGADECTITVEDLEEEDVEETTFGAVGEYVDVKVDDPNAVTSLYITITYDEDEVAALGLNEDELIMYWYDGTNWRPCSNTGVNTIENFIWAIIDDTTEPSLADMTGTPFGIGGFVEFDALFYGMDDTVTVTIADPNEAGMGTIAAEIYNERTNQYLTLNLDEIDNSGVFKGSFLLVDSTPGAGELLVRDGDPIEVYYENSITFEWAIDYAHIDDMSPESEVISPVDLALINLAIPTIEAVYLDPETGMDLTASGIDIESVTITLNDIDVTEAAIVDVDFIEYTPAEDLIDGEYTVTVDVSDKLGNDAETLIWSFTLDATLPTVEVEVDPELAPAGIVTFTLTFSEDMDINVLPTVAFTPEGEKSITVTGGWSVDSLTEWVGTYEVTETTGDGEALISVSDAEDLADNPMDPDDTKTFVIDTTAPIAPIEGLLEVYMNPPGEDDTIAGDVGAVEDDALVKVYSDEACTVLIDSIPATDDGSFPAISIGDNFNSVGLDMVWVTATDAAGNKGIATPKMNDIAMPSIVSVDWLVDGLKPETILLGDVIVVTLTGEAECTATYDVGEVATDQLMVENPEETYTGEYTVQIGDDGEWTVTGHLTDLAGNYESDDTVLKVNIITDEILPIIGEPQVEYPIGYESARPDDPVVITVEVTDDSTGVAWVSLDASSIGVGIIGMTQIGETDVYTSGELKVGDVDMGTMELTIHAEDKAHNQAISTPVYVEVTASLTAYNIELVEGWNLISLPLIPDSPSIVVAMSEIIADVDVVWSYEGGEWLSYSFEEPSDLAVMVDGKGYWVKMNDATTLAISGVEIRPPPNTPPEYDLDIGWNLVGFKETYDMFAGNYLGSAEAACDRIWAYYDGAYQGVALGDPMVPGRGYWIAMSAEGTIYP